MWRAGGMGHFSSGCVFRRAAGGAQAGRASKAKRARGLAWMICFRQGGWPTKWGAGSRAGAAKQAPPFSPFFVLASAVPVVLGTGRCEEKGPLAPLE